MVDMGIHDFDLARWFMGDVDTVSAAGAVLAYPEMASIGDIDNAIATLVFADGRLGVIDLTRNGVYGYDISTELLGDAGTVRVGYLRETPTLDHDEEQRRARHRSLLHGTVRARLHAPAAEFCPERAARSRTGCRRWRMAWRRCGSRSPPPRPIAAGQPVKVSSIQ